MEMIIIIIIIHKQHPYFYFLSIYKIFYVKRTFFWRKEERKFMFLNNKHRLNENNSLKRG